MMPPRPRARTIPLPDGAVHALHWPGPGADAPHILFAHATGMCAAVYAGLLAPLSAHARITAYDARGHGRTALPADPAATPADWRLYGDDMVAVAEAIADGPLLIAGHSFGATVALEAAVRTPGLATRLLLFDPPFIPATHAAAYRALRDGAGAGEPPNPMADRAGRRSGLFPDRMAARTAWHGRGVFQGWPDSALDAYVDHAMFDEADGARLACAPAWEAATYRGVSTFFSEAMTRVTVPFALVAADVGSTVDEASAQAFRTAHPDAPIVRIEGAGHFLPVTHADQVRPWFSWLLGGARPDR